MRRFGVCVFLCLIKSFDVSADVLSKISPGSRAYTAYDAKNFAQAESEYVRILEQNSYGPTENYNVGTALYKQNKFAEAKNHFDRAVKNSSKNKALLERSLFNLGNSYVQLAEYGQAIESYEKALELNPENERTQKNLELARQMLEEQKRKEEEQKKRRQKR